MSPVSFSIHCDPFMADHDEYKIAIYPTFIKIFRLIVNSHIYIPTFRMCQCICPDFILRLNVKQSKGLVYSSVGRCPSNYSKYTFGYEIHANVLKNSKYDSVYAELDYLLSILKDCGMICAIFYTHHGLLCLW